MLVKACSLLASICSSIDYLLSQAFHFHISKGLLNKLFFISLIWRWPNRHPFKEVVDRKLLTKLITKWYTLLHCASKFSVYLFYYIIISRIFAYHYFNFLSTWHSTWNKKDGSLIANQKALMPSKNIHGYP